MAPPLLASLLSFVARPLITPRDTPERVQSKKILAGVVCALFPCAAVLLAVTGVSDLLGAATITVLCACVLTYGGLSLWPDYTVEVVGFVLCCFGLALLDMRMMGAGTRAWPLSLTLVDAALVLNIGDRYTAAVVAFVLTYLVYAAVDRTHFGLHRDVGSPSPWVCDCSTPPCLQPSRDAVIDNIVLFFVFILNLYLTRGFASGMRHQMRVVEDTIEVTEEIAQQLSKYKTDEGRAALDSGRGDRMPPVLKDSLLRLLNNLDEYKPYLPDTLMQEDGDELGTAEPPGLGQEDAMVTMCFTDIQSSTDLWERHPQSMRTALDQHNSILRRVAKEHNGYEVKVIGDAFMLAFKTAEEACSFALNGQTALVEAKWPSELLQHPLCKTTADEATGAVLWNGPRVRIGVHCGLVKVQKNPVTGRCDYFGPTVNTAARVEASLRHGGLSGVTTAVLDAVTAAGMSRLGSPVQVPLGAQQLKGVSEPVETHLILDQRMSGRQAVLQTVTVTAPTEQSRRLPRPSHFRHRLSDVGSDRSSGGSLSKSMVAGPPSIQVGLSRRTSTCATFRAAPLTFIDEQGAGLVELLEVVEMAADATQGIVAATISVQCVVVWNGPRACHDHYAQCLRALDSVRRNAATASSGACSGELLHGNVSGGRRKHAVVVGGCVELSVALAEAAEADSVSSLAAAVFGMYCKTQRRTRRHTTWGVSGAAERMTVWSLTPPVEAEEHWLADSGLLYQDAEYPAGGDSTDSGDDVFRCTPPGTPRKTVAVGAGVCLSSSIQSAS